MAAKRETRLLEGWVEPDPGGIQIIEAAPTLDLGIGGGVYDDVELVSAGAHASIYRAVQTSLQRTVAVKIIHRPLANGLPSELDSEQRTMSQLTGHTGIVPLLDAGTTEGGKPYLVMPFYRRGSLARLVADHGTLPWRQAAFLVETIAVTIAEIHGRGLVHGSLDPSNVLLTDFLIPRVADFARCVPIERDESGGARGDADPRSDVAALGALLGELITEPGTDRPDLESGADDAEPESQIRPAAAVPAPIAALVARATATEFDERPADGAAFVTELRRAVAQAEGRPGSAGAPIGPATGNATTDQATTPATDAGSEPEAPAPSAPAPETSQPDGRSGLAPSAEARYILALVACIVLAVLGMVLAAMLAVS